MSFQIGDSVRLKDDNPLDCLSGTVERVGVRQTRVTFVRLPWTVPNKPIPEMRDFPHEQLVRCRDPWSDAKEGKWSSPDIYTLRLRAVELWLANAQGQLSNARTDLLPHQISLVQEVVERERRRLMIAEEVGMGKTIETGMIMHALLQRRELDRVLVVCPAGQIRQWQDELEEKLRLRFEIYRHDIDGRRAFGFSRVIASLDTIKLDEPTHRLGGKSHRQILLDAPDWDLVVFDEAHRLTARDYGTTTQKTLNYRLAEELCGRTRDFLFLTGTPHDGTDSKFRNLLKALDPEVVFSHAEEGTFFGSMILKNRKSQARDANGELLFKKVDVKNVWINGCDSGEKAFHDALAVYLREGYGIAETDPMNPRNRALGFVMTTFQKLASSSIGAVRSSLAKRLALLEEAEPVPEGPKIDTEDDRFEGEEEQHKAEEIQAKELRKAFAKQELTMLRHLVKFPVPEEGKWNELCQYVQQISRLNTAEKFLIFTEYRGTVAFLKDQLNALFGMESVEVIMGGMSADGRTETIARFRTQPSTRFLISTEAGGEGINLQFCHIVINYDSPWNPFRVVQRIGRVHRIGQERNMQVFNYRLRNALDQRLTECHENRVETAVSRLAEVTGLNAEDVRDQLLGFAQEFIDYEKLYRQALDTSATRSSEEEISSGIKKAEEAFKTAYETIFKHAVSPFNPDRFEKMLGKTLGLDSLREWVDGYLKTQGRRLLRRPTEDLDEFLMPESLKPHLPTDKRAVKGTFNRMRAIKDASVDFLALGHSCIDLLLRNALEPDSGGQASFDTSANNAPQENGVFVSALLRRAGHAAASAFELLHIYCPSDEASPLRFATPPPNSTPKTTKGPARDLHRTKERALTFLATSYPDIDFIEEKLHWLGVRVVDR